MRRFPRSSSSREPAVSSYGARTSLSGPRRLGGSGDRSFILARFLTVGSDAPTALAIDAIGSPPLALLRISSILSTPIIPLWPSSRREPKQRHCWADCGWSACPCSKPKEFRAQARNFPTLKPATSRLSNTSEAPPNLLRDEEGKHRFGADRPNGLWITDVTEFRIPAGKVYLSPIVDCFDGMPLSWSISTSPDAEMANSSLTDACGRLDEGDHPTVHSDRGGHYRWRGWIRICKENGLFRSMSRKGCSPDNARCEGFFGRLRIEFFHGRDWSGVTVEEFMGMLDAYLRWYRDVRIKSDLDYRSPMQYRRDLGLLAA